ncbi:MAG: hypothetical protein JRD93_20165 [Deltaproteobacteria bacterium]|nr:hypothetical protein [Deltaproteobacteria bacterium]
MSNVNIPFYDFKRLLSDLFGQPLNQKAEVAAHDFWQNISAMADGISQGSIAINVDVLALARAFSEYKGDQVWKGLAIFVFWVARLVFIFSWKIALGLIFGSIVVHAIGNIQRRNTGQKFVSGIQSAVAVGDMSKGLGNLCAHYIAGNVQLASGLGLAHWPQLPSDVLTGKQNFIQE